MTSFQGKPITLEILTLILSSKAKDKYKQKFESLSSMRRTGHR